MENAWEILKREAPTRYDEINLALQNCADAIENTRVLLSDKSKKYMDLEKSQEAIELIKVREKLLDIKNCIESIKDGKMSVQQVKEDLSTNVTATSEMEQEEEEIGEEEKYLVDPTIPYKLTEDFANTKPCAFQLQGIKYEVKTFNDIMLTLCEMLYYKNQRLFEKIAREHRIKCGENGKVMICFKQDKAASELPKNKCMNILSSDILIYTNTNTPTKIYAIKELLSAYHLTAFSIYLKWDKRIIKGQKPIGRYLNIDYNYSVQTGIQSKEKPQIGVAQLAYGFFEEYFKDTHKVYDIKKFLDEEWCTETFKMSCPMLKEYNPNQDLKEQTMWGGKNYPSYAQRYKYQINGKTYLISQRWHEQYRDKLEAWINEQDSTYLERVHSKKRLDNENGNVKIDNDSCGMSEEDVFTQGTTEYKQQRLFPKNYKRDKKDCIHYDFKKNQCMCTQSVATFTMPCTNSNTCNHYTQFALHIIPKQYCKRKHCPYCNNSLDKEFVYCTYRPDDETEIQNKLISYRCKKCDTNYVADTVYKGYTHSKSLEDLNITFIKEDLG